MLRNTITLLLSFLFLQILPSHAQIKWNPGYVVKNNNDTLTGDIEYTNSLHSPERVKLNYNGKIYIYAPRDLQSFTINTGTQKLYYFSNRVQLEMSSVEYNKIGNNPEPKLMIDTVFTTVLVNGSKNLYSYTDNIIEKKHFLIKESDQTLIDLVYKKFYLDEAKTKIVANEKYKSQLMQHLTGCDKINFENISVLKYKEEEFIDLFAKYNRCIDNKGILIQEPEEKAEFQFGIIAGASQNTLKLSGEKNIIGKTTLAPSTGFNFGAYSNIVFAKTKRKFSLYNEILFNQYNFRGSEYYLYYENPSWYQKVKDVNIQAKYLKLFTAIRYQFSQAMIKPFIQLGVTNGFAISSSSKCTMESLFYSTASEESQEYIEFRKYEQSLFGSLGASYKKFGLECRYEIGNGMSKISGLQTKTQNLYILLNYRF